MIRIRVVNPIVVSQVDWLPLMEEGYRTAHDPDTQLEFIFLEKGIESPEQHFWEDLQMTFLVQEIERTDPKKTDGLVIFCASDPGVAAAKECLEIPVVGVLETSVALANLLGRRFGWISPMSCGNGFILDRIRGTGLENRLASVRAIDVPVVNLQEEHSQVLERTVALGQQMIDQDDADVLILGCTGMIDLARQTQVRLGVPIIDAGVAGIRMCESLVKMGLSQSKKAFPKPRQGMTRIL